MARQFLQHPGVKDYIKVVPDVPWRADSIKAHDVCATARNWKLCRFPAASLPAYSSWGARSLLPSIGPCAAGCMLCPSQLCREVKSPAQRSADLAHLARGFIGDPVCAVG